MSALSLQQVDAALDALALITNSADENALNRDVILRDYNTADQLADLVVGLVQVGAVLRYRCSTATGLTAADVDDIARAAFITRGAA